MEIRAEEIEGIPRENLHVPREAFIRLWRESNRILAIDPSDSYALGVAITCRWIACGIVVVNDRPGPARSPVTQTTRRAHEELLEREYQAAEQEAIRLQRSTDRSRVLLVEGATATLRWAWRGAGEPPLHIEQAHAG